MKKSAIRFFVVSFVLVALASPRGAEAAPYYENKTMRIIVGFGTGGGYDRVARLLAKHLPKYIPGKPTIIIENMVGAASIIAANYIYNKAKPDGLTIGTLNGGLASAQLLKLEGIKFDVTKYAWIGSAATETFLLTLRADLPFRTLEDIRKAKQPIMLAGTGPAASDTQWPPVLNEYLGLNFKMIIYPSSSDCKLAVERKEVDGMAGQYSSLKQFIERGVLRPWVRSRVANYGIENLPVDEDLTNNGVGKTIMAIRSSADLMARPYVAPPGTPAEVMNIVKNAFAKAAKDPELMEEAKKNMFEVKYVPAENVLKVIRTVINAPADVVKEYHKFIKF